MLSSTHGHDWVKGSQFTSWTDFRLHLPLTVHGCFRISLARSRLTFPLPLSKLECKTIIGIVNPSKCGRKHYRELASFFLRPSSKSVVAFRQMRLHLSMSAIICSEILPLSTLYAAFSSSRSLQLHTLQFLF